MLAPQAAAGGRRTGGGEGVGGLGGLERRPKFLLSRKRLKVRGTSGSRGCGYRLGRITGLDVTIHSSFSLPGKTVPLALVRKLERDRR